MDADCGDGMNATAQEQAQLTIPPTVAIPDDFTVAKLALRPDEVLVMRLSERTTKQATQEYLTQLAQQLKAVLSDARILVVPWGTDFAVITKEELP